MGMFDTFHGKVECPNCHEIFTFDEQTKDYESILADFYIGDYVPSPSYTHPAYGEPMRDYYYMFSYVCPHCKKEHYYAIAIKNLQIVSFMPVEYATEQELEGLSNVQPYLYRKLRRKTRKAKLIGIDEFPDKKLLDLDYVENLKVGDVVSIFDTSFVINKIYTASIDKSDSMSPLYQIWYGDKLFIEVESYTGLKRCLTLGRKFEVNLPELSFTFPKNVILVPKE